MRSAGLHGIYRRRGRHARPAPAVHDDLVRRRFVADAPDRLWLTDITEHPTREGKVYCAAVLDVYSRRIVGWSIADHLRTELVVDALEMARWRRQPTRGETVVPWGCKTPSDQCGRGFVVPQPGVQESLGGRQGGHRHGHQRLPLLVDPRAAARGPASAPAGRTGCRKESRVAAWRRTCFPGLPPHGIVPAAGASDRS